MSPAAMSYGARWCRFEEEVSGVGPRVGGLGAEWVGVYLVCVYSPNNSIQLLDIIRWNCFWGWLRLGSTFISDYLSCLSFVCGWGDSFNTHDLGAKSWINNLCDDHLCCLGKVFTLCWGWCSGSSCSCFTWCLGLDQPLNCWFSSCSSFTLCLGLDQTLVVFKLFKFYRKIGHEVKVQVMEDNSTKVRRCDFSLSYCICLCHIVFVFVILYLSLSHCICLCHIVFVFVTLYLSSSLSLSLPSWWRTNWRKR